ncbi:Choline/ethanolamine kinase [Onchocerca flexuosa]|uniref:Choline/ethanolamine kinase n=1 Tax=Onchocerca flexuosa TaxID=387005 RepID=A0A238C0W6_9BILA|nr:Choline/ethanolamine kinase [Onchocerca flexuosa]
MKQILSELDMDTDANTIFELKERAHMFCARFLGGAWKTVKIEELQLERLKGGMSNMLFLCRLPEAYPPLSNEPDKMLLRIYFNPETESHLVAESVIFTLLSERHLGPKLYGIFSGGRLEEYIPSRPLSCKEISLPEMSSKIAQRLVRVHQLEVPIWKEPDYLCDAVGRWLKQLMQTPSGSEEFVIPSCYSDSAPKIITCADIANELDFLKLSDNHNNSRRLEMAVEHEFSLQEMRNILLLQSSSGNIITPSIAQQNSASSINASRLVIIDFEYASYNHRGFDFANHFVEYSINYDVDKAPFYEIDEHQFPTDKVQHDFFVSYLNELEPSASMTECDKKAKAMIEETRPFVPVSHFFWGVWSLLQVEVSPVDFGFAEYGRDRLGLYYKNKHLLLQLLEDSS